MNKHGLNGNQLKLIAVVTMILDHIGYLIVGGGILSALTVGSPEYDKWLLVYRALRCIGRIAFPVYCFLLVEGYFHTRNWKNYALRLAALAVLSEIPFDLMLQGTIPYWQTQNVFVTLLLSLLMMGVSEEIGKRFYGEVGVMLQFAAICGFAGLARFVQCDYEDIGIGLVVLFYCLRGKGPWWYLLCFAWMGVTGTPVYQLPGIAASLFLIACYNGRQGGFAGKRCGKVFFYLFYPVHLMVLYLIYRVMFV